MINQRWPQARDAAPADTPHDKPTCAEQVYATLKEEIMWGKIEPGTLLSESALAARFGVSRTPVREALGALGSDGLVTTLPQRGHVVNAVSLAEVLDAFRLREVLEVEAITQAVQRITDGEIAHLRSLADTRDNADMPAVNREFHRTIAQASGNRLLLEFIDRLLVSMQRVLILDPHLMMWTEDGFGQELAIVDALAARDEVAARRAMTDHIRSTLASILRRGQT